MIKRAQQKIEDLNSFEKKANKILMKTSKKIEKLNGLVQKNLSSGKNMEGFLLGKVKEYATILDTENFNLRIDLDRELWLA